MLIGVDYPKIEFELFGLKLLEPNAFIGDFLIFLVSLFFYSRFSKTNSTAFLRNWNQFYLWFGITFLLGGFGHLFYNYTEILGKIPSWLLGLLPPYFIEQAMLSIYPIVEKRKIFKKLSLIKLVVFIVLEILVISLFDLRSAPEKGMIIPTLSSTIGLVVCLGILGVNYQRKIHPSFKYLWYAVIVLLLSAIPQSLKINISQYWDRNDLSHLLLILTLFLYAQTIKNHELFNRKNA